MIEADFGETCSRSRVSSTRGGDEVCVEPGVDRVCENLFKIAPHRRLAAGKMQLQRAYRRGLTEGLAPFVARSIPYWRAPVRAGWSNKDIAADSDG